MSRKIFNFMAANFRWLRHSKCLSMLKLAFSLKRRNYLLLGYFCAPLLPPYASTFRNNKVLLYKFIT